MLDTEVNMTVGNKTYIRPGDVLMVDFGYSSLKSRATGKRPAYVVSVNPGIGSNRSLMVIPMYRNSSYLNQDTDIPVKSGCCSGLRYDEYVNILNIQRIERYRVCRRIGRILSSDTMDIIRRRLVQEVSGHVWQKG